MQRMGSSTALAGPNGTMPPKAILAVFAKRLNLLAHGAKALALERGIQAMGAST